MGLAANIHKKIGHGLLPSSIPPKIQALFGDGQPCTACGQAIFAAQVRYEFDLGGSRAFRFHLGCLGLWTADLLKRGWLRAS